MMRDLLWKAYALVYIALIIVGIAISFKRSAWGVSDTVSAVFAFVYFVGLLGFIYRVPVLSRGLWRVLFWFCIAGLTGMAIVAAVGAPPDGVGAILSSMVFAAPLAIALYYYSAAGNPLWSETGLLRKAKDLGGMFDISNSLKATVTSSDTQLTTEVVLTWRPHGYEAKIRRIKDETEESFSNELDDLVSLVRFVETNTPVRVADFHAHG